MYYYIKGTVEEIHLDYIVCEANSIGYQIFVTNVSAFALYQEYKIYLTHIVREDDEQLIGFLSLEEKSIFDQLLTVKGIGVKSALGALSKVSVEQFLTFVENEDVNALKKLPSIGPKAASQIILDLKGKIKPSILFTDALESKIDYLVNKLKVKKFTLHIHPYVAAYVNQGIFSLKRKWQMEYGLGIKIIPDQSLAFLQYKFYDKFGEELDMKEEFEIK